MTSLDRASAYLTPAPRCTYWLGHKYEPRYDLGASVGPNTTYEGSAYHILEIEKLKRPKTYIHDICVRCGHVVKREVAP